MGVVHRCRRWTQMRIVNEASDLECPAHSPTCRSGRSGGHQRYGKRGPQGQGAGHGRLLDRFPYQAPGAAPSKTPDPFSVPTPFLSPRMMRRYYHTDRQVSRQWMARLACTPSAGARAAERGASARGNSNPEAAACPEVEGR